MTENDDRTPADQIVDLLVYAPIGLFFEAPTLLPKLAEQGRVHTRNARLFGQFAVRQGEAEMRRRLAGFEEQTTGLLRALGVLPDDDQDRGTDGADTLSPERAASRSDRAPAPATEQAEPEPDVVDLAITDYDSLSASQVVTRLPGLTLDELEAVRAYEAAHRGRKTILNKIAQLQS
ncbi:MAG TPA: hypothetical protein VFH30_00705 [Acidimicrobiales bacterium]|nr:hypothetical protein [Acidimicrobiales bacterium]